MGVWAREEEKEEERQVGEGKTRRAGSCSQRLRKRFPLSEIYLARFGIALSAIQSFIDSVEPGRDGRSASRVSGVERGKWVLLIFFSSPSSSFSDFRARSEIISLPSAQAHRELSY